MAKILKNNELTEEWEIKLPSFLCPHNFQSEGKCAHWNTKTGKHNKGDCPIKTDSDTNQL